MGTVFTLDLRDLPPGSPAADEVVAWWRWVDATFSTYRPDSAISRIARGAAQVADCPPEVTDVLALCETFSRRSEGYFSARPAGRLDPSGLVKGWSVEVASRMLRQAGSAVHCISAGGDVRCAGQPSDDEPWRVGVTDPFDRNRLATVVSGADLAVATSGTAERGTHVLDPHTGSPAVALASVTVVGTDLTSVDAIATAAVAMGHRGREWLDRLDGVEAFGVTSGAETWWTAGFPLVGLVPRGQPSRG